MQYRDETGSAVGHTEVYVPITLPVETAYTPSKGESDLDAFEAALVG
jgi:hypothetical protein